MFYCIHSYALRDYTCALILEELQRLTDEKQMKGCTDTDYSAILINEKSDYEGKGTANIICIQESPE